MNGPSSLRQRIALTTTLALVAVALILVFYAQGRSSLVQDRYAQDQLESTANLLSSIRELDVALLTRIASELASRSEIDDLILRDQSIDFSAILNPSSDLNAAGLRVVVLKGDGSVAASYGPASVITTDAGADDSFLSLDAASDLRLTVIEPVRNGDRVVGQVLASIDFLTRLGRFFGSAQAVGFARPDGNFSVSRGPGALVRGVAETCCAATPDRSLIRDGNNTYVSASIPVFGRGEALLGTFVSVTDITTRNRQQAVLSLVSAAAVLAAILLAIGALMRSVRIAFRPLSAVVQLLRHLAEGKTDLSLRPLQGSSHEMDALVDTVERVRTAQQEQTRLVALDAQLEAARNVQQSLLPSNFDLAPELAIYGQMRAAQHVGGDFFDTFRLADGTVAAVIADVSGKGIGPALFAARASMILRSQATLNLDIAVLAETTNRELCDGNSEMLFISVLIVMIDPASGICRYVNCGHCRPFVVDRNGSVSELETPTNLVLGAMPDAEFIAGKFQFSPDQALLLYSDGFDEAQNMAGELLGRDRAAEYVGIHAEKDVGQIVSGVLSEIFLFSGSAEQTDDITLLAIRRVSRPLQ